MKRYTKERLWDALVSCTAIFLGLIIVFPVIYCILGAFKTPAEFASPVLLPKSFAYLENFRNALHQAPLLRYMLNSFITAFTGSLIRLAMAVSAAFVLTHYDFRGKKLCFFFLLGTMMMPADTLLMANYATVSRLGLLNSYLGMIIVSFVSASQMFLLRQKFLSFPKALRHAAMLDGCGVLRMLFYVVSPMNKSGLVCVLLLSFLDAWNMVEQPIAFLKEAAQYPISVALAYTPPSETSVQLVCCILVVLPALFLFTFFNRELVEGIVLAEVK